MGIDYMHLGIDKKPYSREEFKAMIKTCIKLSKRYLNEDACREYALTQTKLEEALMWFEKKQSEG